eukprot:Awhi_evm1s12389
MLIIISILASIVREGITAEKLIGKPHLSLKDPCLQRDMYNKTLLKEKSIYNHEKEKNECSVDLHASNNPTNLTTSTDIDESSYKNDNNSNNSSNSNSNNNCSSSGSNNNNIQDSIRIHRSNDDNDDGIVIGIDTHVSLDKNNNIDSKGQDDNETNQALILRYVTKNNSPCIYGHDGRIFHNVYNGFIFNHDFVTKTTSEEYSTHNHITNANADNPNANTHAPTKLAKVVTIENYNWILSQYRRKVKYFEAILSQTNAGSSSPILPLAITATTTSSIPSLGPITVSPYPPFLCCIATDVTLRCGYQVPAPPHGEVLAGVQDLLDSLKLIYGDGCTTGARQSPKESPDVHIGVEQRNSYDQKGKYFMNNDDGNHGGENGVLKQNDISVEFLPQEIVAQLSGYGQLPLPDRMSLYRTVYSLFVRAATQLTERMNDSNNSNICGNDSSKNSLDKNDKNSSLKASSSRQGHDLVVEGHYNQNRRMCKFFLVDKCHYGQHCRFAHSQEEIDASEKSANRRNEE